MTGQEPSALGESHCPPRLPSDTAKEEAVTGPRPWAKEVKSRLESTVGTRKRNRNTWPCP